MSDAASNVGAGNGLWILIFAILGGGGSVITAGLVEGKKQAEMSDCLKWGIICLLLSPILIGWIMACCIACKTKELSG